MYVQSGHAWHTLHFIDARRLLELQQYQVWMEKQHQLSLCDPFGPIRRLEMVEHGSRNPEKPLTSFRINDILADTSDSESSIITERSSYKEQKNRESLSSPELNDNLRRDQRISGDESAIKVNNATQNCNQNELNIIRPWNFSPRSNASSDTDKEQIHKEVRKANRNYLLKLCNKSRRSEYESEEDEEIDVEGCDDEDSDVSVSNIDKDMSPLDALVAMSSKTFLGLENFGEMRLEGNGGQTIDYGRRTKGGAIALPDELKNQERKIREEDQHGKSQIPKKKRKTRTAFTNQQIYELEKRFILQKYLTPSDRDEIAAKLGLSCAQVITWFQNRRAKFKRDIEEMKHDVVTTSPQRTDSDNDIN